MTAAESLLPNLWRRRATASFAALAIAFAALCSHVSPAHADDPVEIVRLEAGFRGQYQLGVWTPVRVTLRAQAAEPLVGMLLLTVPDGEGVDAVFTTPVALATRSDATTKKSQGEQVVLAYVMFGQSGGAVEVQFATPAGVAARRTFEPNAYPEEGELNPPLPAEKRVVLALGPELGLSAALGARGDSESEFSVVAIDDPEELPTRWFGYDGIDTIVATSASLPLLRKLSLTTARGEALRQWVRLGGRLIVSIGREGQELLAAGSLLGELAPGKFAEETSLRRTAPVEAFAGWQERIDVSGSLPAARLAEVVGNIEAFDGARPEDLPLVVRAPCSLGQVVFAAIDLDRPPLADWGGRPALWRKLLGAPDPAVATENSQQGGAIGTFGYGTLAGQLQSALDEFEGVRTVPFGVVAGLALLYILLIGPVDYLLVKYVFKRMEATWITFTCWVVGVSVLAFVAADWLKGRELRCNQVEVVDVDLASGLVQGHAWLNVFSPQAETYDIGFGPQLPGAKAPTAPPPAVPGYESSGDWPTSAPQSLVSWAGRTGESLRGMHGGQQRSLFNQQYLVDPGLDGLRGAPIQVWSTKGFQARWQGALEPNSAGQPVVEAELTEDAEQFLSGTITCRLGFDVKQALLVYGRWIYRVPEIKDGAPLTVSHELQPLTLKTHLTQQRTASQQEVTADYDYYNAKPDRIVELMMFHEAAGGETYTRVGNDRLGAPDFTELAKLGRAVLVVRAPQAGSRFLRDGQPLPDEHLQSWSWYRFVLPVARTPKS